MCQQLTHFQNIMLKRIVLRELRSSYNYLQKYRAINRFARWFRDTAILKGGPYYCDSLSIPPFEFREFDGVSVYKGQYWNGPLRDLTDKGIVVIMDDKDNPRYAVTFINTEKDSRIINQCDHTHSECSGYGVDIYAIDIDWVLKQDKIPDKIEYLSVLYSEIHNPRAFCYTLQVNGITYYGNDGITQYKNI